MRKKKREKSYVYSLYNDFHFDDVRAGIGSFITLKTFLQRCFTANVEKKLGKLLCQRILAALRIRDTRRVIWNFAADEGEIGGVVWRYVYERREETFEDEIGAVFFFRF